MSRSVDLFIGSSLPIDQLAELLRTRSGAQLVPTVDPERWRFIDGAISADLFVHPYVDDGELWLSRYRYVLSTSMADGIGPIDSGEVLGLRHLAQILHDPVELPVLLVLDLQYRLPAGREVADGRRGEEVTGGVGSVAGGGSAGGGSAGGGSAGGGLAGGGMAFGNPLGGSPERSA